MKIRTIFVVDILLTVLFFGVRIFIAHFPNSSDRLRYEQEGYSHMGESEVDNAWAYFIINKENPLPEGYEPQTEYVQDDFSMDSRCAEYARRMIAAAESEGIELKVVSAYRSTQKQQENLEAYIERMKSEGYSAAEAEKIALREIAEPGTSEHNAGLALDILTEDWWESHDDVTADFENTEEFEWLSQHAHEYGFILRYPKDAEKITGYAYEPWHYRFVGVYYAGKIKESGLPFEYYYISIRENRALN